MVGRVIQQLNRLANGIAKLHHARQKFRAPPTTLPTIVPFYLQPCQGRRLPFPHRRPPGVKRIYDEVTRLVGAAKGQGHLPVIFIHDPARNVFLLQAQIVIARLIIAPREATTRDLADVDGRFTINAQAFDGSRCRRFLVFFSMLSKMASVSLILFCGLALTTLRSRKPMRLRTSAIVLGEGNWSSR